MVHCGVVVCITILRTKLSWFLVHARDKDGVEQGICYFYKDHLVDFLVKNKLINPSQHGFLKARSCLTNMLCFLEDVTKWVGEGSPVDIICFRAIM